MNTTALKQYTKIILRNITKVNMFKSIYYSLKFHGPIVVGKAIIRNSGGVKFLSSKSILQIGVSGTTTVPAQLIINGEFIVDGYVDIYKGTKIVIFQNAKLSISDYTYINEYSRVFCRNRISIGSQCSIAWSVSIMDTDLHSIYKENEIQNPSRPISIGNQVWIGAASFISKGSCIHDNTIIGYGAKVKGNVGSNVIYCSSKNIRSNTFDHWD